MRQLLVASEYGEPSRHQEVTCQKLFTEASAKKRNVCLLLITKNLPGCLKILDRADTLSIPTQIHCTITGLGNTSMEPHISFPDYVLEQSIKVIEKYKIDPKAVTIRIDPLVPESFNYQMNTIPRILGTFAGIGVRDCRR